MSTHRILLADPDQSLLKSYSARLCAAGFEVDTATDALGCVERLRRFNPDFLVLEPSLPWGQGAGILSFMREEADVPLVPVVVLTSGTDLLEDYQLPRFPVLERHQKPLAADKLVECLAHLAKVTSAN